MIPQFAPSMPVTMAPMTVPPAQSVWAPPSMPASRPAVAAQPPAPARAPAPVFRGVMPDEPPPPAPRFQAEVTKLAMPSPEEMGISRPSVDGDQPDWAAFHRRLDILGARSFHVEKLAQGGYELSCLLPTSQADRCHRVEATAATEAQAIQMVLQEAEQWLAAK